MKKKIALFVFIILILIGVFGLYKYIMFNKHYASSNAVFVKSDSLTFLSFKIPGKIEKIYVKEGDNVKKGMLLAKLTTKELEFQKEALQKDIMSLIKKIDATIIQRDKLIQNLKNQKEILVLNISKLEKLIEAKAFGIDAKRYKLEKLKKDYLRFKNLYRSKKVSKEKFENIKTSYFALKDEIKADEKVLESMFDDKQVLEVKLKMIDNEKKEIKRLTKIIDSMEEKKNSLEENLKIINTKINNSYIYAPFDAVVAKKFANSNEVIGAGRRILSIVNPKDLYVLNLLEETKMKGIIAGCEVKIHIDALDREFDGVVDKILPVSASTFALLPRDVSSGEFTKLAQRFYVKIRFKEIPKNVLVGMSGEVVINRCNEGNEK